MTVSPHVHVQHKDRRIAFYVYTGRRHGSGGNGMFR